MRHAQVYLIECICKQGKAHGKVNGSRNAIGAYSICAMQKVIRTGTESVSFSTVMTRRWSILNRDVWKVVSFGS